MLAEDYLSAGPMSGIYESSRKRVEFALNNNIGQRMTQELAVGLFMLVDECLRDIVTAMTPPAAKPPVSSALTDSED